MEYKYKYSFNKEMYTRKRDWCYSSMSEYKLTGHLHQYYRKSTVKITNFHFESNIFETKRVKNVCSNINTKMWMR
jgi:hypothetical protein